LLETPFALNVPSLGQLRGKLRLDNAAWPQVISCLCQAVDILPLSTPSQGGPADDLELLTDALCASSLAYTAPQVSTALLTRRDSQKRSPRLNTHYDPSAALSPDGLQALRAKVTTYRQWTEKQHINDNLVLHCVEVEAAPAGNRVSACKDFHTMGNAGLHSGKLLAARAFEYEALASNQRESAAERDRALSALKASLTGIYNLTMMAGASRCASPTQPIEADDPHICGDIFGRDNVTPIDPATDRSGLPVRGYARLDSALLRGDDILSLVPGEHYFPNHRFHGHLLGIAGQLDFAFEERESGDDTFATLLGMTAAYDALKKTADPSDWRRRIVEAAEAFGHYYVRHNLTFSYMNGEPVWTNKTGAADQAAGAPLLFLQNLAWLKAVIYLSEDFRGDSNRVADAKRAYQSLSTHADKAHLGAAGLVGMAALLNPVTRDQWKLPIRYFYQSYNDDYWVISSYLLARYETDPVLNALFRRIASEVVRPLVEDNQVPWHTYALLASRPLESELTVSGKLSQQEAIGAAAATLRQYREVPAPFGNPEPETGDPTAAGFYYTNYSRRPEAVDTVYQLALSFLESRVNANTLGLPLPSNHGGAQYPLGPGLVPNYMGFAYSLIGGEWGTDWHQAIVFGRDLRIEAPQLPHIGNGPPLPPPPVLIRKTVRAWSNEDFLLSYWLGQHHAFLEPARSP
jgi:hypothetical protein